ncbi:hypothetical protein Gohar_010870 [Gossypium harknessii]|uniref:Zinc knuckle CX2CX4HX4C domain-containing protein n=1 Tax=Gossypium harknessii TaxID=34285 RepID=A0A7J9GSF3_9ROSI|nr:hypothetical protein [Gossypium harknessii]
MDEAPAEKLSFKDNLLLNRVLVESDNAWPEAVGFELGEEDVVVENKGSIPEIHFSDRVHNLIDGSMGNVEIRSLTGIILKSIFRAIANVIGKVIKIDYNTTEGKRDDFSQRIKYEGLLLICYVCGHYGHINESYVHKDANKGNRSTDKLTENISTGDNNNHDAEELHGPLMVAAGRQ